MADLRALEYDSLRAAIRVRALLAPAILVAVVLGWAALTLWVFTTDVVSAATLVPLMVLASGFEALYTLQIQAERLARYLQVEYEEPIATTPAGEAITPPRWETTALSYRQRFTAPGSYALFSVLFLVAIAVNYLPAAVTGTFEELVGLGFAHAVLAIRILIARRVTARLQREELERFRALLAARAPSPPPAP